MKKSIDTGEKESLVVKKLLKLLEEIEKIDQNQRTASQKSVLKHLKNQKLNYDELNELLKDDELYKGLEYLDKVGDDVTGEEWDDLVTQYKESKKEDKEKESDQKNIVYYDVKFDKAEWNIIIKLRKPEDPVPGDIFTFIKEVDIVQNALNELFDESDRRTTYFKSLVGIARVGGTSTYIELAKQQLEQFKSEIILQKGSEIKLNYLKELGLAGLAISTLGLVLLLLKSVIDIKYQHEDLFENGVLLVVGACIGTWLSFAIRKKEVNFQDLRLLNGNKRSPLMRMLVLVFIAIAFYFMFVTNFLNIAIGDSFSTELITDPNHQGVAFLVGIFLGLAENTIGPALTNRVQSFTDKI